MISSGRRAVSIAPFTKIRFHRLKVLFPLKTKGLGTMRLNKHCFQCSAVWYWKGDVIRVSRIKLKENLFGSYFEVNIRYHWEVMNCYALTRIKYLWEFRIQSVRVWHYQRPPLSRCLSMRNDHRCMVHYAPLKVKLTLRKKVTS